MSRTLLDLVCELNTLNDDNLADRVIANNDVQWCLGELQDILEAGQPTLTPPNEPLTCEGCAEIGKWENEYEYGYPSPCTRCKRRTCDNYRRPPERQEDTDA